MVSEPERNRGFIMSTFAVLVVRVVIEPHDNADALEIARVGDYRSIVRKGQFTTGELVAYIPEQSVLPGEVLDELGLRGKLAGKEGNRVKAIKLRGVLSQGLVYPARAGWVVGRDWADAAEIIRPTMSIAFTAY